MDHIAILRKSNIRKGDNLLGDILRGTKTIESRWYVNRIAPWNRVEVGETIFFKESGCSITAKAKVSKVLQYDNLSEDFLRKIVDKYSLKISPSTTKEEFLNWLMGQKEKRYCILIFLKDVERIEPFEIDKTGYGNSCAWLVADDIDKLKV